MNLSLNELEAMAKKAARGAGYTWGMAEEAGAAVRWLSRYGLDGCAALVELFDKVDGEDDSFRPNTVKPVWIAESGTVCSLAAGVALADHADRLKELRTRIAGAVSPILLLPFCADAARLAGKTVQISSDGGVMATDGISVSGSGLGGCGDVDILFGADLGPHRPTANRAAPSAENWAKLSAYAERTYAPATEASRLKGAGAGINDND